MEFLNILFPDLFKTEPMEAVYLNREEQKFHHTYCSARRMPMVVMFGIVVMILFMDKLQQNMLQSIVAVAFGYGIAAAGTMNYYSYPGFSTGVKPEGYPKISAICILYLGIIVGAISGHLVYTSHLAVLMLLNAGYIFILNRVGSYSAEKLAPYESYSIDEFYIIEDGEKKNLIGKFAISENGKVRYMEEGSSIRKLADLSRLECYCRGERITKENYREYLNH